MFAERTMGYPGSHLLRLVGIIFGLFGIGINEVYGRRASR